MLSRTSAYAIRALAFLGARDGRPWMLARDIADELGMPPPFLGKVLQTLTAAGLLESQRGRGGGFRLLRDPDSVTLIEIVEPFDRPSARKLCVLGQKLCGDEHACPLHHAWKRAQTTFLTALTNTTLADVERMEYPGSFPWGVRAATRGPRAPTTVRKGQRRTNALVERKRS